MYYLDVLTEFYKEEIRYLIVGGVSVNLHGVPRVTQDIDFILAPDEENILKVMKILRNLEYIPTLPVDPKGLTVPSQVTQWINEKNMIAFSFHHKTDNYKVIDIVISHNLDFEQAYRNVIIKQVGDINIYVATIDDIIKMKQITGREQDRSDIELLTKVKKILNDANV